jgi:hypothetical protein
MKNYKFLIFSLALLVSSLSANPVFAKTSLKNADEEIQNIFSKLRVSNGIKFNLVVFLDGAGELRGVRINSQDHVLRISPDGRVERQVSNSSNPKIIYTDASRQHIRQLDDIEIVYTNSSFQNIHRIGDIEIIYTDTSFQHVRRVGNINIQYTNTSYSKIKEVIGNQSGVQVIIMQ